MTNSGSAPSNSLGPIVHPNPQADGAYAVLVDWRAVQLRLARDPAAPDPEKESSSGARDRGYRVGKRKDMGHSRGSISQIFVYVSETAEEPIVLSLSEAELHEPDRPSARIDGLRPMFFYTIQAIRIHSPSFIFRPR